MPINRLWRTYIDYYRRGIGTIALEFAMDKARSADKTNMVLWVFEENLNAIKFYEKCGFAPDGASKIYNFGKEMNCIRMRRASFVKTGLHLS